MGHGISFVILPYYVPYVSKRSKGSPCQCYTSVCDSYYCWQHAVYISAYSVLVDTIQASPYTLSYNVHGKIIMYTHAHTHTHAIEERKGWMSTVGFNSVTLYLQFQADTGSCCHVLEEPSSGGSGQQPQGDSKSLVMYCSLPVRHMLPFHLPL